MAGMSNDAALNWAKRYCAIVVAEYVRRSQPLPDPSAAGVYRFRQELPATPPPQPLR
jgi:hypothetical protein